MRRYETVMIIDPDLTDETRQPVLDRVGELIEQHEGFLVESKAWGNRKLAYEIKKKIRGYYVLTNYCGDGTLVSEIERYFRITDDVLKYMTVLLDTEVDVEQLRAQAAAAEEEAAVEKAVVEKAAVEEAVVEKESSTPAPPVAETPSADSNQKE